MLSRSFLGFVAVLILTTLLLITPKGYGGMSTEVMRSTSAASFAPQLFDVSLGYNYIHLDQAGIEEENTHGLDVSAFVNLTSWLGLGGDFMFNAGHKTIFGNVDLDNRRLVYIAGPRISLWQTPRVRLFAEALAGGVHAELEASRGSFSQTLSADGFAAAGGFGLDWRLTRHISWRVIQADYLPTNLGDEWQNNFRVSTGVVFSFGGKE